VRKDVTIPDKSRGLLRRQIKQRTNYNVPTPRDEKNNFPLVSIGIPTYNSNGAVLNTLASILYQYPNLEVIISDNASQDNTQSVCQEICKKYPQIRYVRQNENIGLMPNFDFLLKQATGEYFMWVSDDDNLEPEILQKYVTFLNDHPDYALVSGQINYCAAGQSKFIEKRLSFEHRTPWRRVVAYYFKVAHGGMYHGLMRRNLAAKIPMRKIIGLDWHFVASMAFFGKIKNFDFIGYNKKLGGSSRTFRQFAFAIGDSIFAGRFPYIKIGLDACSQIMRSPVFDNLTAISKILLAVSSMTAVLTSYYFNVYPFVLGGKIKRFFKNFIKR
jgi:glycosyltransferase involved in cell wall biosynthesis